MTEREVRLYEYKVAHRAIDLGALIDLEQSMMLRILVYLLDGPHATSEIYRDGEFYHNSLLMHKLRRLEEMGLITMVPQDRTTLVDLTPDGRALALQLNSVLRLLKKTM